MSVSCVMCVYALESTAPGLPLTRQPRMMAEWLCVEGACPNDCSMVSKRRMAPSRSYESDSATTAGMIGE